LIYPTHSNIAEELHRYDAEGINVAAYPVRTTLDTDHYAQNCWNQDADKAEQIGLPVAKTICGGCPHRETCVDRGYLSQMIEAKEADVCLATHKRTAVTGFKELTVGRTYISVHEDPLAILRPTLSLNVQGLDEVAQFVTRLLTDPFYLDWYADGSTRDEDGNVTFNEDQIIRRNRIYEALLSLDGMVSDLQSTIDAAEQPTPWTSPVTIDPPRGFEGFLWWAINHSRLRFTESPWQFLLSALNGQIDETLVIVTDHHIKGARQGATQQQKQCVGVIHNNPPNGCVVWINDATADAEYLETLVDGPVHDQTPDGRVPLQHRTQQYVRDITRKTTPGMLLSLVRGLLCKYRDRERIGVITHSNLLPVINRMEPEFSERIVKTTYFGSGDERSSNAWHNECDLILILGTPRVPPSTVITLLAQIGELKAAQTIPKWDVVHWYARTTQGEQKKFEGRGYYDPIWLKAHRAIVRSNLVQAVGRGRGILDNGCDVILLSSDECGLLVIDERVPLLNERLLQVCIKLQHLTARKPNNSIIGKLAVSTSQVANAINAPQRTARQLLSELEQLGLIHRESPRSGWMLTSPAPAHTSTLMEEPIDAN
ncbi:MAG: hypothetical protein KDE47_04620, partial [Caldilineaceae bacterium]|nr:hypothetical protein [Caldilineaceae bacterium]